MYSSFCANEQANFEALEESNFYFLARKQEDGIFMAQNPFDNY